MNSFKLGLKVDDISKNFENRIMIKSERANDHLIVVTIREVKGRTDYSEMRRFSAQLTFSLRFVLLFLKSEIN